MASSGYMTELTTEGIWGVELTTAQFDLINVRLGSILNFTVRADKDAQTDVTDTKVLPMLEQASEEALFDLLQAAKTDKFNDVWQFVNAKSIWVMSRLLFQNRRIIAEIKEVLEAKVHLKYSGRLRLTSHSDSDVIG